MKIWTDGLKIALLAGMATLVLGGCASSMSGGAYPRAQARQAMEVKMGVGGKCAPSTVGRHR